MRKRGAIEIQFNWIFVFMVGAMILLFFFGFVSSQRERSDQILAYKVVRDTSTIITPLGVSSGKSDLITIIKPIEFSCDPSTCTSHGCTSSFSVQESGVKWETPVQVIFSPDLIKGRKMVTWSVDWGMPYRVTNFIYLTSPDGKGPIQLTKNAGNNESPAWSPDGSLIAFGSTRSGTSRIYVMNANGANQRRLLVLEGEQTNPSWSPRLSGD